MMKPLSVIPKDNNQSANRFYEIFTRHQYQFISLPFDDSATMIFGTIRTRLESLGTPIGPYDLQIASIAINHNLTLVTHNTREFNRVDDLQLEDWEIE